MHQVEGFQPLQSIQPVQPVQHLPQAQPMQQLQPMQPPQSLPQVQQVQQVQQMVLSPSSPSPGQAKPSQVARQAGARPASDDVLVSFTCRFPGCGKVYCSSDGARKHARIHHRQWLTDVEKDTRGREIDAYCIRWERKRPPATNPVAEQSRMPPPFATMRMIDGAAPGMPVAASCGVPPSAAVATPAPVAPAIPMSPMSQQLSPVGQPPPHPTAQPPPATAATPLPPVSMHPLTHHQTVATAAVATPTAAVAPGASPVVAASMPAASVVATEALPPQQADSSALLAKSWMCTPMVASAGAGTEPMAVTGTTAEPQAHMHPASIPGLSGFGVSFTTASGLAMRYASMGPPGAAAQVAHLGNAVPMAVSGPGAVNASVAEAATTAVGSAGAASSSGAAADVPMSEDVAMLGASCGDLPLHHLSQASGPLGSSGAQRDPNSSLHTSNTENDFANLLDVSDLSVNFNTNEQEFLQNALASSPQEPGSMGL